MAEVGVGLSPRVRTGVAAGAKAGVDMTVVVRVAARAVTVVASEPAWDAAAAATAITEAVAGEMRVVAKVAAGLVLTSRVALTGVERADAGAARTR